MKRQELRRRPLLHSGYNVWRGWIYLEGSRIVQNQRIQVDPLLALYPVGNRFASSQKEHGSLLPCAAQLCQHGPAVPAGEAYIFDEFVIYVVLDPKDTFLTISPEMREITLCPLPFFY